MDELLYLDTARIGRMSPEAHRASVDYLTLAGREGGSAYFGRFVREGLGACPVAMHGRYPGLASWNGLDALKRSLRLLAGSRSELPVLLAARSAQLMKLASRLLFHSCRRVLTTDLSWPGYHSVLEAEGSRIGREVLAVRLCDPVLKGRATEDEVVEIVCREYAARRCDGLFLTAVSHLGVRTPVARIVRQLESTCELRFVVVDGAQDFCHASADLHAEYCDLYLAGCHKWLRAYHPLGLGFYGRRRSSGFVATLLAHMTATGEIDDPLLRYVDRLGADVSRGYSETVNLAPLFACQGAVADGGAAPEQQVTARASRLANLTAFAELAAESGWQPTLPDARMRSGILLARANRPETRRLEPEAARATFRDLGVGLTAYEGGFIRLSMPEAPLPEGELRLLRTALLHNA